MPSSLFYLLQQLSHRLNQLQTAIANVLRWLILAMTLTVAGVVIGRLFGFGSTAVQESVTYMHGTLFMLCMAYTAHAGGHVRVDIFYRRFTTATKAWVNLLGAILFLLPFAVFIVAISWHAAVQSWQIQESSINPGGLPFVYVLRALIPLGGGLIALHAVSDICQNLVTVSIREQ